MRGSEPALRAHTVIEQSPVLCHTSHYLNLAYMLVCPQSNTAIDQCFWKWGEDVTVPSFRGMISVSLIVFCPNHSESTLLHA
jgi:hypothetical protein